jgi:hypothetical protein
VFGENHNKSPLKCLEETIKNLRNLAKIKTGYLLNTILENYCYTNNLGKEKLTLFFCYTVAVTQVLKAEKSNGCQLTSTMERNYPSICLEGLRKDTKN